MWTGEKNDVIHHLLPHNAYSVRDAIVLPMFKFFRMERRKRFEYATCGRGVFFLKQREKISLFQKYLDKCGRCLKVGFFWYVFTLATFWEWKYQCFFCLLLLLFSSQEINILSVSGNSFGFADLKK